MLSITVFLKELPDKRNEGIVTQCKLKKFECNKES
jgi:hypothetical protein